MLFNSYEFLILLAVTLPLYHLRGSRTWQVAVLLAASSVFYAWENPKLLFLLGFSCAFNALAVERIIFWKNQGQEKREKRWLTCSVALNLAFLGFFKYGGLLLGVKSIPLPIGISFYTFHAISLLVDVHRRKVSEETVRRLGRQGRDRISSFSDLTLYIIFFPQLVAGPIVKAHQFIDQIRTKLWNDIPWVVVRRYLVTGYFLKIFVADNLCEQTAMLTLPTNVLATSSPVHLMALLYGYGLQIFADFAGYSLIAIGLGLMFGYRLPENFRFPYLAASITEFWRRWHLSLSSWLRDYLYIPLGGNRKGPARTYINLFLVMFLGGLWHGAEWKFALWGTLHGVLLAVERFIARRHGEEAPAPKHRVTKLLMWIYTFHAVMFLWLTFLMPDLHHIAAFFQGLTSGNWSVPGQSVYALVFYGTAIVLYHLWGWILENRQTLANRLVTPWTEGALQGLMLFLILTNPGAPRGFIYFQF
ncbi:MAG: MBOAT family O-acyltransferase [Luteolibacter sp.]